MNGSNRSSEVMAASEVASPWTTHFRETVLLGLPLIAAQLAQMALNVTNTVVLGRVGPEELAASVLGWQFFFVLWMFGSGFGFAVMPLVANAIGSNDPRGGRRFVRMGLWISFAYGLLMMVPLWNAEAIFRALGQDPRISALAAAYIGTLKWSLFPQLAIIVLRSFLGALGRPGIVVIALVVGVAINAGLNVVLVFGGAGVPALGMQGSGLATLIATCCVALFLVVHISRHRVLRRQEIFVRFFKPDMPAIAEVFRLGWPMGTTVVAEVALFTATSFMMGVIGPMELAAHGIALQLSGVAFMIPLGLSAATTIRVGHAYGAGNHSDVSRAAMTSLGLGLAIACLSAAVFLTVPRALIALYLDMEAGASAPVIPIAVSFLAVAGIFQIVDGVQALSSGALRGLKEARAPMVIALLSYWAIGVPVGYGLAFPAGWGGIGIWWGLAIGLAAAAILMTLRLSRKIRRPAP
ncbi:MAG: MATE family efflux transporter [Aquamicrobium sp.]|uniref:MATE family efflux transporter n=1 Tax=Aquamicrobium sp. TaxID=1872579 RepID=UPI00349EC7C6|nr:MATE family efflux transporter [Aquamicrobium sp.]